MNSTAPAFPRHIVVSGGSRGLGQAIVAELLRTGHKVSSFSRRETEFTTKLRDNINFCFQTGDISDPSSIRAFLLEAEKRLGPPDGLVNCAGVAVDGVLATMKDEAIDKVLGVNLKGTLQLTRLVIRRMLLHRRGGSIVNVSSIVGLRGYSGLAAYSATKAGMDAITRALARELGDRQIRVNSVAPGYIATEMTRALDEQQRQQIVRRTPLGRLGEAEDVALAVSFLLSDAARFVTGHVLVVDGGISS
jgi:3-oxoacyl-[acyl-carrier protein] reductase